MSKRLLLIGLVMVLGCSGTMSPGGGTGSEPGDNSRLAGKEPEYKGKPLSEWTRELKDERPKTRKSAVQALGEIGPGSPSVVPALIEALKDKDSEVRNEAVDQLQKFGPTAKAAVPGLIVMLKDENEATRWDSAEALEAIGPAAKEAVPALVEALNVRRHVAEAIKKIDPETAMKHGVP